MIDDNLLSGEATVIIADDDCVQRLTVKQLLQNDGYKLIEAGGIREVVDACCREFVDLVVINKIMLEPEMDVATISRAIKTTGIGNEGPSIIIVENQNDIGQVTKSVESGIVEQVTNTTHWSELKTRVQLIVDQRRTRQAIKRANKKLADNEQELRVLFNNFLTGIVYTDIEGVIRAVNPASEMMFGITCEGHELRNIIDFLPDARAIIDKVITDSTCKGKQRGKRLDGTGFAIELVAEKAELNSGPMVVFSFIDIEQRVVLENQLQRAQKMQAIGQLTSGMAHDFNNILAGMMGYASLAERGLAKNDGDKIAECLREIQAAGQRAAELIQRMLAYSRGVITEEKVSDPGVMLSEAMRMLRPVIPSSITMNVQVENNLPAIRIDTVHFHQIIINICINARDAMRGAGTIDIKLKRSSISEKLRCDSCQQFVPAGNYVSLSIKDNGPGIATAKIANIFDPFCTTKEIGKGSGLGLSMVHGLVHGNSGHIIVNSSNKGAEFKILFPVVKEVNKMLYLGAKSGRKTTEVSLST